MREFEHTLQIVARTWDLACDPVERRAAADRYRTAVANSADQIERIAQVSYEAGERGILELLDAYRTTASARARPSDIGFAR